MVARYKYRSFSAVDRDCMRVCIFYADVNGVRSVTASRMERSVFFSL